MNERPWWDSLRQEGDLLDARAWSAYWREFRRLQHLITGGRFFARGGGQGDLIPPDELQRMRAELVYLHNPALIVDDGGYGLRYMPGPKTQARMIEWAARASDRVPCPRCMGTGYVRRSD